MIGKNIHNFFPEFLANAHQKLINGWIDKEVSSNFAGKIRETFLVNSFFESIRGAICLKVHPSFSGIKLYVIFAKDNDNDYLILNETE